MLYFDANATAPPLPEAEAVYLKALQEHWHNPSSLYRYGVRVHELLEILREEIADLLGCHPKQIVFNSGTTEGNNAIFAETARKCPTQRALVSAIEHPSVIQSAKYYFPERYTTIRVDASGQVDLNHLEAELVPGDVCLVSIMAANNETGVIQPWQEALNLCHKHHTLLHVDAAQHLGKRPAKGLGDVDFISSCGHKSGGPRGTGFIKIPTTFHDFNGLQGGGQENGHRSGTEDYPGLAAMVTAFKVCEQTMEPSIAAWTTHRNTFEKALLEQMPEAVILGTQAPRLANTSCVLMPDFPGTRWVAHLNKHDVALSSGSACASGETRGSRVLNAMGVRGAASQRAIRISAPRDVNPGAWITLAQTLTQTHRTLLAEQSLQPTRKVIQLD